MGVSWLAVILLVLGVIGSTHAKFTHADCRGHACLQKASEGVLRYYPDPVIDAPLGICANATMATVVNAHAAAVAQGTVPSTQYYDMGTLAPLGGAQWSVKESIATRSIAACHTGPIDTRTSVTTCYVAEADDDFASPTAAKTQCSVVHITWESSVEVGCWTSKEAGLVAAVVGLAACLRRALFS